MTRLLYRHFGQKVIVLIDEYDVPLDKAHQRGYYSDMAELIRSLLSKVTRRMLKPCLE
ncbi:MAG: AAA family ATPase [Hungatella sp.]|nr:AAA family ATPase [Hungatella sp.]MCI9635963.1 AAA family ATPase [Hungatella sp.]